MEAGAAEAAAGVGSVAAGAGRAANGSSRSGIARIASDAPTSISSDANQSLTGQAGLGCAGPDCGIAMLEEIA